MKNRLLFVFLLCSITGMAQKVPYTDQEFILRGVEMKKDDKLFHPQLNFSFVIFGRYAKSQLEPEPGKSVPGYALKFWLADAHGDTLVSPTADPSLLQPFSFFANDTGRYKSYSFGHSIHFPYSAFKKSGNFSAVLWAQAQSPQGGVLLKPFQAGSYSVSVPKLYPLESQRISVKNVEVTANSSKQNTQGVLLRFYTEYQYAAHELFSDAEESDEVTFYAEFTGTDGSPVTMAGDPQLSQNDKNTLQRFVQHPDKGLRQGELFMPYTQFFLPEGVNEVNYTLHAVSENGSRRWDNLAKGKFTFRMPPVYFAKAAIRGLEVTDRSYDVAAKDIPILNLFVSSKSNRGKGYPDLFWTFGTENWNFISTQIINNSFWAADDSCVFQMMENDRLYLNVYDYDLLSRNDILGTFAIPPMRGNATYRQDKLKSDDVINGQIYLERRLRPAAPQMALYAQTARSNGITGYQIWGSFGGNKTDYRSRLFMRLPNGNNQIPAWQPQSTVPSGADFSYFIPAWEYPVGAGIGLLVSDAFFGLPLGQKYAIPDQVYTETRDVQLQANRLQPTVRNGVNGLLMNINANYPAGLVNQDLFRFKYQLKELSGVDLQKLLERLKPEGSPVCGKPECTLSLFIPYYRLPQFSNKDLRAALEAKIDTRGNFVVGKTVDTLTASIPEIIPMPKAQFSLTLKLKSSWTYVDIAGEYDGNRNIAVKENSTGGKMTLEITFPADYVYKGDILSVVITPYEFRTAQEEIRWNFTAEELLKSGTLKLKKTAQAKKPVLQVH